MIELGQAKIGPVRPVQMVRYAAGVDDFNPVHFDDTFARSSGLPGVIVQGPLTVALAVDAIVSQTGLTSLRALDARLRAPVFPSEELSVVPTDSGAEVRKADGTVAATLTFELA